ncbi:MAG: NADH-ubiquinone oxidoreductase-F iron-sulfur binding region domain-containing protein, partial [Pseudomonadota bacterium]
MDRVNNARQFEKLREGLIRARDADPSTIRVCLGPGCLAQGADKVLEAFQRVIQKKDIPVGIEPLVKETGCDGFCKAGPLVKLSPSNLFYTGVHPDDVEEIVERTLIRGEVLERLLYSENGRTYPSASEIPFYKNQHKIATRNLGKISPRQIEDALTEGAYMAAVRALTSMGPEDVVREMEISGLRGRGGAGFPTGRKWRSAIVALKRRPGAAYVVCNGDEGDPGAFMDRAIMEGDPHAVIEGMIIGAYAIGAKEGFIYVRAEYPIAIRNLQTGITQAREAGLLGENILGTGFSFDIQINRGAGAFVCGESTALFTSIEGRTGEPRAKYIRSVERGLWERPTVLNNVETWANVPVIIEKGGKWFAGIGVPGSPGTKAFSLVGKVKNVGLVEVPMGVPLSEIVEKIGGGVPQKGLFKAVQTGGPSGGCIPYALRDVSVDFDSLAKIGSMMGSGGMIVMDETDCVVDVASYFLRFLEEESCGKCLPCRLGLKAMLQFLDSFAKGEGTIKDIDEL